jgi:CopG family nickel-responsive transcriptional regulator
MTDTLTRFTVSLPTSLLASVDQEMVERGYSSRSEFVRDLIRDRLARRTWDEGVDEVFGTLTILYDHHVPGLAEKIMEAQHNHLVNVLCTTHVHVSHDDCLEAIILRGRPDEIENMVLTIGGMKGVRSAHLSPAVP